MIRRAGGVNVVTEGGAYPLLGLERVLVLDPDVIVNAAMGEAKADEAIAKDRPGWARVRAVREGRVVRIRDEVILRPGPRIGEALAELARTIHPEASLPLDAGAP
jgi:iron complex transport system substrate-binding protein